MATIRLQSPVPRERFLPESPVKYPIRRTRRLTPPAAVAVADFFSVLNDRQTRRQFGHLSLERLGEFLWHVARTRMSYRDARGREFQFRPSPSAGACHPHDVLVIRCIGTDFEAMVYDSAAHALAELKCEREVLRALVFHATRTLARGEGTILWLAGQPWKTQRYYKHAESLLWRDAGALLGMMAMVAEALGLAFCPLGITGDPEISRLFGPGSALQGFGGAIVGAKSRAATRWASAP